MTSAPSTDGMQVAEDQCPICMNEAYLNTTMRLMVAHCGHKYCETCICGAKLAKHSFVSDSQFDKLFDKEVKVRKKILAMYNKSVSDFRTKREYNDYLEQVEDIIYNLVNDVNTEKTKTQVEEYKRKNEAAIVANQAKKAQEEATFARQIQLEKDEQEVRRKKTEEYFAEQDAKNNKRPMRSKPQHSSSSAAAGPASATMATAPPVSKPSAPSYVPASVAMPKAPVFVQPQPIFNQKPDRPLDPVAAAKAAGYADSFARKRCIEEAFSSLSITARPE